MLFAKNKKEKANYNNSIAVKVELRLYIYYNNLYAM